MKGIICHNDRCSINEGKACKLWSECQFFKGEEIPKGNKYGAHKTELDGKVFDSNKEARRYAELFVLQRAGKISDLRRQVRYVLIEGTRYGREIAYVADFVYKTNGEEVVEDVKSKATKTAVYRLKKRLLAEKYGIIIKEYE